MLVVVYELHNLDLQIPLPFCSSSSCPFGSSLLHPTPYTSLYTPVLPIRHYTRVARKASAAPRGRGRGLPGLAAAVSSES